jgi:hypothetical protein
MSAFMNVRLYKCPLIQMSAYTNVRLYKCSPHQGNTVVEHSPHHHKARVQGQQPMPVQQMLEKIMKKYNLQVFHLLRNPIDKL